MLDVVLPKMNVGEETRLIGWKTKRRSEKKMSICILKTR